jgi:hypothetical protein
MNSFKPELKKILKEAGCFFSAKDEVTTKSGRARFQEFGSPSITTSSPGTQQTAS